VILGIFGQTPWAIHAGLALVNIATTLLLFALGRRVFGRGQASAAAVAAALFAVLSLDRFVLGVFAHATHFVVLYAGAGLHALAQALESRRPRTFVVAGLLLGAAVLMKQHAAAFVALAFVMLWHHRQDAGRAREAVRAAALTAAGVALPVAFMCLVFAM